MGEAKRRQKTPELPFNPNDFSMIPKEPPMSGKSDYEGIGIVLTGDGEGEKQLEQFLRQSRSGGALVSNEVMDDFGRRSIFIYVRKIDGELFLAIVGMDRQGITRKAVIQWMKKNGVKVEYVNGIGNPELIRA
jgi:hypothetical protein